MKLTLIRHGITHGNKYGLYYGATDLPLLEEGVEELRERKLSHIYPTAPRYYTSPLQRTQQTLREIYGGVDFTVVDGLREMNFGAFEMRTVEDLRQDADFVAWSRDVTYNRCPGGESFADVHARALEAIAPILTADEDAVCVIHGGVIATLMFTWFPGKSFNDWMIHPGTGWQITVEDGKPVDYRQVPFVPVV
jgi:broad specificity phosphatase PhoE